MNNLIMRSVAVADEYHPLSTRDLVASVTVSCLPTNAGPVFFRGDDGSEVPWLPGEWHEFWNVNLAEITFRGTEGDVVTVVGGTW